MQGVMLKLTYLKWYLYYIGIWKIYEHKKATKQIRLLPVEIAKRYEKWKDIVRISGPDGLKQIKGFKDEALSGVWSRHHSSRLNIQYRVIYKVKNNQS